MTEQIEQLTEDERRWLESDPEFQKWYVRRKVLRLLDAHAAALAARGQCVAELEQNFGMLTDANASVTAALNAAESEVARLREALAAAEQQAKRDARGEEDEHRMRVAAESRVRALSALLKQHGIEHDQ